MKRINKKALLTGAVVTFLSGQSFASEPKLIRLEQGWTPQQRADYYWGSQGSALISYDIYLALKLAGTDKYFNSAEHADRVGLLMDPPNSKTNPDNLPIGISKTVVQSGQFAGTYMGMTCAACHTGQVQYKGQQIRIDGGAGTRFNIVPWITSLSEALDATLSDPSRFAALAADIKKRNPKLDVKNLKARLEKDAEIVRLQVKYSFVEKTPAGPGRMDALESIHNSFMGINTGFYENVYPWIAPVKPPFLWNAPQSAWVQWSGIAPNPLRRNFGESLGVFSRYDLKSKTPQDGLFDGTNDIRGQVKLERLLQRLTPPKWPEDILGKLDQEKVARGEKLFTDNCQQCHTSYPYRWSTERAPGKRFIENAIVPQKVVGTDGTQFMEVSFSPDPIMVTGHLAPYFNGKAKVTAGEFNQAIQNQILIKALKRAGSFSKKEFAEMNNYTNYLNEPPIKFPERSYKAAPRDGAWATGPFLHNGSVPTIYELLTPASERIKTFYVTREFDPIKLGIETKQMAADNYLFDTSVPGNSNMGHSFEKSFSGKPADGVIGRELSPDERYAIIEYLKSIPKRAAQTTPYGGPKNAKIANEDPTWYNSKNPYNGLDKGN